ncbi:MAG: BadF/BadG/BcrA/BcrD ATPase family protein [Patescibacteria group bacterium]|jgi:N-acetylglucosamine kinase
MSNTIATKTKVQPQLQLQTTGLVLGLDVGATKTTAAIGDSKRIYSQGENGPGNIHDNTPNDIITHLRSATDQAVKQLHLAQLPQFRAIVVGMAGIDSPHDQSLAEKLVIQALKTWLAPHCQLQVMNDIHIVRSSGSDDPYGMALIAGTGSHCFGINHKGELAHAGGLEYILSDEGSAYEMGLKALRAAIRSGDGRIKPTGLEKAVLKHFKVGTIRSLEPVVYHGTGLRKTDIAQLAKLVDAQAKKGDWRALEIIDETMAELVLLVSAVVQRLKLQAVPFDLVVVGGVFNISALPFLDTFKKKIKPICPRAEVIQPKYPPVYGAVRLAAAMV